MIILQLVGIGVPVFLLGSWLFSEFRMRAYKIYQTSNDFELSATENQRLQSAVSNANTARNRVVKAQQRIKDLKQQGKNLRVTKSGKFDSRNKLGKNLNRQLPLALEEVRRANKKAAEEEAKAFALSEIPQTRAQGWIKAEANRSANRIVIICFTASLLVCRAAPDANLAVIWPVLFLGAVGLMYLAGYF